MLFMFDILFGLILAAISLAVIAAMIIGVLHALRVIMGAIYGLTDTWECVKEQKVRGKHATQSKFNNRY